MWGKAPAPACTASRAADCSHAVGCLRNVPRNLWCKDLPATVVWVSRWFCLASPLEAGMSRKWGCICREKKFLPGNFVCFKVLYNFKSGHPNCSRTSAFYGFLIHQECSFSTMTCFYFQFNSTTDLMLIKSFMPVIMQHNATTSHPRVTVRREPWSKAQAQNIWTNKESLLVSVQSQQYRTGISHSRVVLIPVKGADEIMCGHSYKAIQVTW